MTTRVAFPFVGDTIGGSHVSAALLMGELRNLGFAPVAVVHGEGPLAAWLAERGIEVMRADLPYLPWGLGGVRALVRLAVIAPRLGRFLRNQKFNIVHLNDGRMIATWTTAARLAGIAAIVHSRTKWSPSRLAYLSFRSANRIIAISKYVRDGMPGKLQRRTVVIANPFAPNAVSRAAGRAAVSLLVKPAGAAPVIAFIGTLQAQKRPEIFLSAAQVIRGARPDVRFLLIGRDGELGDAMRALARRLTLDDAVTFAGFQADVPLLLAGCDLLLAPAVDEGHGRALIEAMLSDCPVVASASGGHREALGDGEAGVLVPSDNAEALAAAAIDLLDNPGKARTMAAAANAWAQAAFSPAHHAKAIASVYQAALQG